MYINICYSILINIKKILENSKKSDILNGITFSNKQETYFHSIASLYFAAVLIYFKESE